MLILREPLLLLREPLLLLLREPFPVTLVFRDRFALRRFGFAPGRFGLATGRFRLATGRFGDDFRFALVFLLLRALVGRATLGFHLQEAVALLAELLFARFLRSHVGFGFPARVLLLARRRRRRGRRRIRALAFEPLTLRLGLRKERDLLVARLRRRRHLDACLLQIAIATLEHRLHLGDLRVVHALALDAFLFALLLALGEHRRDPRRLVALLLREGHVDFLLDFLAPALLLSLDVRRLEIEVAQQRAVVPGRLSSLRLGVDLVEHRAQRLPDFDAFLLDLLREVLGEDAVATGAVLGGVPGAGRIDDQRALLVAAHLREATRADAAARLLHLPERVVATRVENDDPLALARLSEAAHQRLLEIDRFVAHFVFVADADIDRQQIIASLDLHAVPRVIQQCGAVLVLHPADELAHHRLEVAQTQVLAKHHLEAHATQRFRDETSVVDRIHQRRRLVVVVADDERKTPIGRRAARGCRCRCRRRRGLCRRCRAPLCLRPRGKRRQRLQSDEERSHAAPQTSARTRRRDRVHRHGFHHRRRALAHDVISQTSHLSRRHRRRPSRHPRPRRPTCRRRRRSRYRDR